MHHLSRHGNTLTIIYWTEEKGLHIFATEADTKCYTVTSAKIWPFVHSEGGHLHKILSLLTSGKLTTLPFWPSLGTTANGCWYFSGLRHCCSNLISALWPHHCGPWNSSVSHAWPFTMCQLYITKAHQRTEGQGIQCLSYTPFECLWYCVMFGWLPQKSTQKHFWLYLSHTLLVHTPWSGSLVTE